MNHFNWLSFVALFIFLLWIFPSIRNIPSNNKLLFALIWLAALVILIAGYHYFFEPDLSFLNNDKPIYEI